MIKVCDPTTGEIVTLRVGQADPASINGLLIDFRYTAGDGVQTRRSILCWRCWSERESQQIYVTGYCPFREDMRTFRVDRMRDVLEIGGNKQIAIGKPGIFFAYLASDLPVGAGGGAALDTDIPKVTITWVERKAADEEEWAIKQTIWKRARRNCIAGLLVLKHIMLADEALGTAESNIELAYIEARLEMCEHSRLTWLIPEMLKIARQLVPPENISAAMKEVAKDEAYFRTVRHFAEQLADRHKGNARAAAALDKIRAVGVAASSQDGK